MTITTRLQLGPTFAITGTFDVLHDVGGRPYVMPLFPKTFFNAEGEKSDMCIFLDPNGIKPNLEGPKDSHTYLAGLSLLDGELRKS